MATDKVITQKLVDGNSGRYYTEPTANPKDNYRVEAQPYEEVSDPHANNPFADPEVAERYAMIYEKAQYECRHVFDPTLTWTSEEEKVLVRKLDWRVCLWAVCCLLLFYRFYGLELIGLGSVSCSLVFKSIEEILFRLWRIIYWMIST
jgi:hypothetical protein